MSADPRSQETDVAFTLHETRQILAVCQCLEQPLQVSLGKLCEVGGYASAASANAMWYKLRTKLGLIDKKKDSPVAVSTPVKTRCRTKQEANPSGVVKSAKRTTKNGTASAGVPKSSVPMKGSKRSSTGTIKVEEVECDVQSPGDSLLEAATGSSDMDFDDDVSPSAARTKARSTSKKPTGKAEAKIKSTPKSDRKRNRAQMDDCEHDVGNCVDSVIAPVKHIDASLLPYIENVDGMNVGEWSERSSPLMSIPSSPAWQSEGPQSNEGKSDSLDKPEI